MAISPAELQSRADRLVADEDPGRVLDGWLESYAELWREREELRERIARLEAQARTGDRPSHAPTTRRRPRPLAAVAHAVFAAVALLAAAAFVAMFAVVSGLYELDDKAGVAIRPASESPAAPDVSGSATAAPDVPEHTNPPAGTGTPTLRLSAVGGESWIQVVNGSRNGEVLYEGVLASGHSTSFTGERFFLRLGAPGNLAAEFASEGLKLPETTADVVVDDGGIRVVSVG